MDLADDVILNKQVALKVVTLHKIKDPYVSKNLNKFNTTTEDLIAADKRIFGDDGATEENGDQSNFRGVRTGRSFYTREEDLKIINFLLQNRRYQDVKGRAVWQVENKNLMFVF